MMQDPKKNLWKIRDLTLMAVNEDQYLAVACDSDGAIGNKPQDVVKVSEKVIAQFAVRVPLFEIISCGAVPFLVIDCLSVEMEPSGERIVTEIRNYVREAGINEDIQVTGSSEENVPTVQTGIGVTILGMVDRDGLKIGSSQPGDRVLCAGIPKSGPDDEVRTDDPEILSLRDLQTLRKSAFVHDILPVGSKGIGYEAQQLAQAGSLTFRPDERVFLDGNKSAGPSTCVLLTVPKHRVSDVRINVQAPVFPLGTIQEE